MDRSHYGTELYYQLYMAYYTLCWANPSPSPPSQPCPSFHASIPLFPIQPLPISVLGGQFVMIIKPFLRVEAVEDASWVVNTMKGLGAISNYLSWPPASLWVVKRSWHNNSCLRDPRGNARKWSPAHNVFSALLLNLVLLFRSWWMCTTQHVILVVYSIPLEAYTRTFGGLVT